MRLRLKSTKLQGGSTEVLSPGEQEAPGVLGSLSFPVSPKNRMPFLRGCVIAQMQGIQTDKAEPSHH